MSKTNKLYSLIEDVSSTLFLVVGLGLMFYEVVMRYVFDSPTTWINETASILVVWAILLGLSVGLRDNHHISVDIFYVLFPPQIRKAIDLFANVACILFCIFFVYNGCVLVLHTLESGQVTMDTRIPMWLYYIVVPISGLMFMVRFIERLIRVWKTDCHQTTGGDMNEHHSAF
ncbi:TRAP transporter small permease [Brevibacillus massiliensis]|uniref:TRAP transporter small permease n=1 Tax=Brevibacillus massiliensis TaxID=1118054 RepID=UPI0005528D61|nr:TRAP transporter small permease [Brevibacillus massiliensis]